MADTKKTPVGPFICAVIADIASPFHPAVPVPTTVEIKSVEYSTLRILALPLSAIYKSLFAATEMPIGLFSEADHDVTESPL